MCAAILAAGAAGSPPAHADGLSGLFIGGSVGRARNGYDTGFVDEQYQRAADGSGFPLTFSSRASGRESNAWWTDVGYMRWPMVGFDAEFLHLGELTHRTAGSILSPTMKYPFATSATVASVGPALSLIFCVPLTDSLIVDARVGGYIGDAELRSGLDIRSKYTVTSQSARGSSLLATVGVAYTIAAHWQLRVDYLHVNKTGEANTVGRFNVDLGSAGLAFVF